MKVVFIPPHLASSGLVCRCCLVPSRGALVMPGLPSSEQD